ncbi:hypothetical protein [Streptomyces sp. NPDC049040]|uniref:hypothetical protein n=1 Tax=Streptomyces sp. NPDC049040 TaxID=3365593 RepID=UPI003719D021
MFRLRGRGGRGADAPADRPAIPAAPQAVPAPAPPRGEWRELAVQRTTFAAPRLLTAPDAFASGLGTWQNPSLSGELAHAVTPTAPSGLVSGIADIAAPAPEAAPAVPEPAPSTATPAASAVPLPVRPSAPEPRLTVARLATVDLPVRPLAALPGSVRSARPEPVAALPQVEHSAPGSSEAEPFAPGPAPAAVQRSAAPLVGAESSAVTLSESARPHTAPEVPEPVLPPVQRSVAAPPVGRPAQPAAAAAPPVGESAGPHTLPEAVPPSVQRSASAPLLGGQPQPGPAAGLSAASAGPRTAPWTGAGSAQARPLGLGAPLSAGTETSPPPGLGAPLPPPVQRVRADGASPRPGYVGEPLPAVPSPPRNASGAPVVQRQSADSAPGGVPAPSPSSEGGPHIADASPEPPPSAAVAPLLGDATPLVQRSAADAATSAFDPPATPSDGPPRPGGRPPADVPQPADGPRAAVQSVQRQQTDGGAPAQRAPGGPVAEPPPAAAVAPLLGDATPLVQRSADPASGDPAPLPGGSGGPMGDLPMSPLPAAPSAQRRAAGSAPPVRLAAESVPAPLPPQVRASVQRQEAGPGNRDGHGVAPPAGPPPPGGRSAPLLGEAVPLVQRSADLTAGDPASSPESSASAPASADPAARFRGPVRPAVQRVGLVGERGLELRAAATPREPEEHGTAAPAVVPVVWTRPDQRATAPAASVQRQAGSPPTGPDAVPVVQRAEPPAAGGTAAPQTAGDLALAAGIASREPDGSFVFAPPAPRVSVQREPDAPEAAPAPAPPPEPPPTTPAPGPAPAAAPAAPQAAAENTDELVRRLLAPLTRLLRAELRLDRERAGMRLDSRH